MIKVKTQREDFYVAKETVVGTVDNKEFVSHKLRGKFKYSTQLGGREQ